MKERDLNPNLSWDQLHQTTPASQRVGDKQIINYDKNMINTQIQIQIQIQMQTQMNTNISLGKPVSTKTDEFLENFRTAFDPPPPAPFSGKFYVFFYEIF